VLGDELVDPSMEGHLLDPKFLLGSDKNPGHVIAGLLAVNALLVSFTIDSSRFVAEADIAALTCPCVIKSSSIACSTAR